MIVFDQATCSQVGVSGEAGFPNAFTAFAFGKLKKTSGGCISMKKITYFYLENCPYCQNAKKAMDELKEENPDYSSIEMDWIEEERQPDLAKVYNYYYVPTMFIGANKLYEAKPGQTYDEIKTEVRKVFDAALEG